MSVRIIYGCNLYNNLNNLFPRYYLKKCKLDINPLYFVHAIISKILVNLLLNAIEQLMLKTIYNC